MRKLLIITPLLLGFAAAQDPAVAAPDIGAWFASTAALATIVVAAVAFLKRHVLKTLDGLATVLASLAVGGLLGLVGHWVGFLTDGLMPALGFGVSAGLIASGGWDAITGLLGKRKAAQ
ncbi:MAG: hypothetical protein WC972_03125 [Trueperaceae bacterium]